MKKKRMRLAEPPGYGLRPIPFAHSLQAIVWEKAMRLSITHFEGTQAA